MRKNIKRVIFDDIILSFEMNIKSSHFRFEITTFKDYNLITTKSLTEKRDVDSAKVGSF